MVRISEILDAVYDSRVGWRPASGAIKPVHIANGLCREILNGQYFLVSELLSFVIPYLSKKSGNLDPKRTYNYLVHTINDPRYDAFRDTRYKDKFERLRDFVRGLVAADGAVFPQERITSFTLTTQSMVSIDNNDREVGRFMAYILRGKEGKGKLAAHLTELLREDAADPISFLISPLLNRDPKFITTKSNRCSPYDNEDLNTFFANLEEAATCLHLHEAEQGNRLATLQHAVHFVCICLLSYTQALSKNGELTKRNPLLLVMDVPKGSSLALASEQSLQVFYEDFETWLAQELAKRILTGQMLHSSSHESNDGKLGKLPKKDRTEVRKFFSEKVLTVVKGETPSRDLVNSRMSFFEQSLNRLTGGELLKLSDEQWALVLGDALVQSYIHEYESGGPKDFLQNVGRKAGIIYPNFQGRSKEKRFRPSVPILDVLVRSCCPVDAPIPLPNFLDKLWETFGIIVGGRTGNGDSDHDLLVRCGIEVSENDLEENTIEFIEHLVQIGLARQYPDNISYVGKFYA
jgi:hypothetical protein